MYLGSHLYVHHVLRSTVSLVTRLSGRARDSECRGPASETKQLPGYCEADMRLCSRICRLLSSHDAAHIDCS